MEVAKLPSLQPKLMKSQTNNRLTIKIYLKPKFIISLASRILYYKIV